MDQLICGTFKYPLISVGMVQLFWLMRDFMVNHDPLRFRRGLSKLPGLDILGSEKEIQIPFEKGGIPVLENTSNRQHSYSKGPQKSFVADCVRMSLANP